MGQVDTPECGAPSHRSQAALHGAASGPVHPGRPQTVLEEAGGIHVSAETARRLAGDAGTVAMQHGPGGGTLAAGRGPSRRPCAGR